MRTYGRVRNQDGSTSWVKVESTNGDNTEVYLTTLVQTLKLNLGESPFWANYGIPAQQSVATQVFPDYYVAITQGQFAQYFNGLTVTKLSVPFPAYNIRAITPKGSLIQTQIAA